MAGTTEMPLVGALDQVSGWRKLVDFEGLTRDSGFYVYEQALQYVITPGADFLTTQPAILATKLYRVTLTRTAAKHVTAYIVVVETFIVQLLLWRNPGMHDHQRRSA